MCTGHKRSNSAIALLRQQKRGRPILKSALGCSGRQTVTISLLKFSTSRASRRGYHSAVVTVMHARVLRTPDKTFEELNVHAPQSCRAELQRSKAFVWSYICRAKTLGEDPFATAVRQRVRAGVAGSCAPLSRAASAHLWPTTDFRLAKHLAEVVTVCTRDSRLQRVACPSRT